MALLIVVALLLYISFNLGIIFLAETASPTVIVILEGDSADIIADKFIEHGIIRNKILFLAYLKYFNEDKNLLSGTYLFNESLSVPEVVEKLKTARASIKITIPEGWNVNDIGNLLERRGLFAKSAFVKEAMDYEGMLYPDTYEVFLNSRPNEIIDLFVNNFLDKTRELRERIEQSGRSFDDVINMASMLEKESYTNEDRRIVAGILWKRIDTGYPLQVDATIAYITGKNGLELSLDDLEANSPYNTYKNIGLPPGPISNPGINSITAAIEPKITPYWFYLHDKDSLPHYAITFEEHKKNKFRYLR